MSAGQTEVSGILRETSYSTVEDIDAGDKVDPQLASDYVKDIYSYLRQLEVRVQRVCDRSVVLTSHTKTLLSLACVGDVEGLR